MAMAMRMTRRQTFEYISVFPLSIRQIHSQNALRVLNRAVDDSINRPFGYGLLSHAIESTAIATKLRVIITWSIGRVSVNVYIEKVSDDASLRIFVRR